MMIDVTTATEDQIVEAISDYSHGRRALQEIERQRARWNIDKELRERLKRAIVRLLKSVEDAQENRPRTLQRVTRMLLAMHEQDMQDQRHLEGQRVNLTTTVVKAPDEEAKELLDQMRRRDVAPRVFPPNEE